MAAWPDKDGQGELRSSRELSTMRRLANLFTKDQSGGTAIEYSMIAAIVSISVIVAVDTIGPGFLASVFTALVAAVISLIGA